ncbi:hypothetical protein EJ03DRAFT_322858 [Teratosphaeria nubilosa]|uniref:Large ribosomal subunit protein uL29m n=1 Tax=Teratosphaeria nubilosa TaxID=161662 RepID=A0A6G1LQ30_9PEZI|nr:hypothetical protein EJ03DRAFT_322858 [Teratosphaeria nubilosa]
MHCTCASLLRSALAATPTRASILPPAFLLPARTTTIHPTPTTSFSTTPHPHARRDHNRSRGVSALRRTGIGKNQILSVRLSQLPKPVLDPARRTTLTVNPDHGLWDFLPPSRTALHTPEELTSHGRAWSVAELRNKDWVDLHRLHWMCVKERNRIATTELTRTRTVGKDRSYGAAEVQKRDAMCKATMRAIRYCLTERWYAWENARVAGMEDEEVDLYADLGKDERAYLPKSEFEDEPVSLRSEDDARTDPTRSIPPPESRSPGGEARP